MNSGLFRKESGREKSGCSRIMQSMSVSAIFRSSGPMSGKASFGYVVSSPRVGQYLLNISDGLGLIILEWGQVREDMLSMYVLDEVLKFETARKLFVSVHCVTD
ncbi:hypothetical protein CBM2585_A160332 [Cupriavidus taiwanensis]|nr:hypothetical protein CBM2585_A160332 [Cupriavidus taiwanensis]